MGLPCTFFRQTAHVATKPSSALLLHHRRWVSSLILFLSVITFPSHPSSHDGLLSASVPQFPLCGLQLAQGQVIGMDLGSEFVKVALVAPGRPMEIILNAASKRKTSHAVSFADSEKRDMGDEGAAAASKRPDHVFMHSNLFLGLSATEVDSTFSVSAANTVCEEEGASQTDTSEKCAKDQEARFLPLKLQAEQSLLREVGYPHGYYPYRLYADRNRHTVAFLAREGMYLSAEMVTANFLAYLRKMAAQAANVPPTTPIGVVISIPCRFSQRQRQALRDAAEIAGLRPVALVHHAAAAAIQHALDTPVHPPSSAAAGKTAGGGAGGAATSADAQAANSSSSTTTTDSAATPSLGPSTKLFVDVGSAGVDFSLVRFEPVPASSPSKAKDAAGGPLTLSAQMLSCETLYGIGGHNVDIGLAEMMREAFQKRYPAQGDLRQTPRALKKLLRQAVLSKHILSANKKTQFSVEGLLTTESGAELDLHELVDRSHVESVLERMQLRVRMQQALQRTLQEAQLELKDVDEVELLGGGWRVPHVQQELSAVLDGKSPGMHLNGDEAMATGAAFIAANNTVTFRVKKYFLTDITPYQYSVKLTYRPSSAATEAADGGATTTTPGAGSTDQQRQQEEEIEGEIDKQQEDAVYNKDKADTIVKRVTLYARNSKFGGVASSKSVSVRTAEDLTVELLEDETVLETIAVRGVPDAIKKQRAAAAAVVAAQEAEKQPNITAPAGSSRIIGQEVLGDPKVSLVFTVDGSGVLAFDRAFAAFTIQVSEEVTAPGPAVPTDGKTPGTPEGKVASEAKSEEGAAADEAAAGAGENQTKEEAKEETDSKNSSTEGEDTSSEKGQAAKTSEGDGTKTQGGAETAQQQQTGADTPTVTTVTQKRKQAVESLTGERVLALPFPLTQEEKQQLQQQLADLEAADLQVHLLSEGINRLETFIYATRNALDEESVQEVMKPEDLEKLRQQLQDDEDYLYTNAKQDGLEAVQKRQEELEAVVVPMRNRAAERTARPNVVKAMNEGLAAAATRLQGIAELQQQHKDWPPAEKVKKAQQVNETVTAWWKEKSVEQEKRQNWEDPAFTLSEARKKLRELEAAIIAVEEAPKPTPPKQKSSGSSSNTAGGKKSAAAAARRKKAARDAKAAAGAEKATPTTAGPGDAAAAEEDKEERQQQQQDGDEDDEFAEGSQSQKKETEKTTEKDTAQQQGESTDKEPSKEEGAAGETAGQQEKGKKRHDEL